MNIKKNMVEDRILKALDDRVSPSHSALLIIDMQKDFCIDGYAASQAGRPLGDVQQMIPSLQDTLEQARSKGVLVCHVGFLTLQNHFSDTAPWLSQRRRATYANDRIAMQDSEGADFIDELKPREDEVEIRKHRYSAFKGTNLDMVLRANGIKTVVPVGVSTNVCVESTIRDAFELGYYVCVPEDLCASWDRELHNATLKNVNARFGLVCNKESLLSAWNPSSR
ncbi:cysteine hydrolase family protein [Marinobacterium arenosum]|uniref:cysteine hydrolase family protein n=1 Tax=Marinobacterium arenosum TaxID=2862496 RepID=UPI001C9664A6|nr:isochorismatase family cysteine hydrolase [Marinobacterium arenosum]MBY4677126.1 cysteine hydrolase [Marinobacterium arenosum]